MAKKKAEQATNIDLNDAQKRKKRQDYGTFNDRCYDSLSADSSCCQP